VRLLLASPAPSPISNRPMIKGAMVDTSSSTAAPAASRTNVAIAVGRRPTWLDSRPSTRSAVMVPTK
jgi:hypothetical protein